LKNNLQCIFYWWKSYYQRNSIWGGKFKIQNKMFKVSIRIFQGVFEFIYNLIARKIDF
jgi:hypothetical protein